MKRIELPLVFARILLKLFHAKLFPDHHGVPSLLLNLFLLDWILSSELNWVTDDTIDVVIVKLFQPFVKALNKKLL